MTLRDWALITFTILVQMSVGSFLVLGVVHFYATRKAGMEEADRMSDRALLAIVPVLVLAFGASLLHLGNPANAYRAVSNIGTSWLSREILTGVSFAVFATIYAFLQWRKIGPVVLRTIIAWIAAILGVALVYIMSNVYMLPTQPSWNTFSTPVSFYATTLLLGALAIGMALVANYASILKKKADCAEAQCALLRDVLRGIAVASIILVGIELVVLPVYVAVLATGGAAAVTSVKMMAGNYLVLFILRIALAFLGAGVFALFLYRNASSPGREKVLGYLAYSAFFVVLAAEVIGRFMFYATHVNIGL
jgi:anaerobic dimethyl sulfoxide reductase subunit C (anchor subunit)